MAPLLAPPHRPKVDWSQVIPDQQWALFRPVLITARARGLRFAIGGGLAFSAYSGRLRNTKDMDLFVRPADREALITLLTEAGYQDYYEQLPYDRKWIYRGIRDGEIIDVMWQMANYRTEVDDDWLTRGPIVEIRGEEVRLLAPEELLWSKLYVLQRERCDWPDLLNILYTVGPELDWAHLLERLADDAPVLGGLLNVFGWLCPERARDLPSGLWHQVGLLGPATGPRCDEDRRRVELLDRRDWFGPQTEGS
jgi:hypothetical protein